MISEWWIGKDIDELCQNVNLQGGLSYDLKVNTNKLEA
jgi:hypothetical protein